MHATEKAPGAQWGGGHPSMSQLKRWCFTSMSCTPSFSGFFSFSCREAQRPGSVHRIQTSKDASRQAGPGQPRRTASSRAAFTSHYPPPAPPFEAEAGRGPAVWRAGRKGGAATSLCPSCVGSALPPAPGHCQRKQLHPQLAPGWAGAPDSEERC